MRGRRGVSKNLLQPYSEIARTNFSTSTLTTPLAISAAVSFCSPPSPALSRSMYSGFVATCWCLSAVDTGVGVRGPGECECVCVRARGMEEGEEGQLQLQLEETMEAKTWL